MKIAMTGATGFIGTAMAEEARRRGHQLVILARQPGKITPQAGDQVVDWSSDAPLPPHDAAVHLAGESVSSRWTEEKKRLIMDSRRDGTRRLVDALSAMPAAERPRVLVSASAVGYYGERGDEILTEDSAPAPDNYLSEVCKVWETEARRAEELGIRVACLRLGVVLGKGGGALGQMLTPFKMGVGGPVGNGRQWFPWVHRTDVLGVALSAVENAGMKGPFNVVSPGIVRGKEFAQALGKAVHRPAIIPTPVFALQALLGDFAKHLVESQHVVPKATLEAGYTFQFPELEAALQEIVG